MTSLELHGHLIGLVHAVQYVILTQNIDHRTGELCTGLEIFDGKEGFLLAGSDDIGSGILTKSRQCGEGQSDLTVFGHVLISGRHFPDTDPKYKGADSRVLLRHVVKLVRESGYFISNVDVTMIAQKPKLKDHIPQMVANIAADLQIPETRVNVKATTEEKLGFTGSMEGLRCHAVCLLEE